MGAEQSTESKKKDDEKYQRMMKNALEQQRKMYEAKCKELLQEQQKAKAATENLNQQNIPHNSRLVIQTQENYAPLYPNLQADHSIVSAQPSTTSAYYHPHSSNTPNENTPTLQLQQQRSLSSQNHHATHSNLQQSVRAIDAPTSSKPQSNSSFICQPSAPTAPEASDTIPQIFRPDTKHKKNNNTYQCPSCKINRLENNIFQCQKGHSSCNQCKINAIKCGICQSHITNTRNIDLEHMVAKLQANNSVKNTQRAICPNKSDGCSLTCKPEYLQDHLKQCIFREMECPVACAKYSECMWRGKINQIQAHFLECHPNQTGAIVNTEMSFEMFNNNYQFHHVALGNFNFLVHVKLDSTLQTLFMTIQLIGSLVSASKWSYEFHVYDKSEARRKFTYIDVCLPSNIPFSDIAKEGKCIAMPLQYALSFFKDNKLTYKFYIKRDESKRRPNQRGAKGLSYQSET